MNLVFLALVCTLVLVSLSSEAYTEEEKKLYYRLPDLNVPSQVPNPWYDLSSTETCDTGTFNLVIVFATGFELGEMNGAISRVILQLGSIAATVKGYLQTFYCFESYHANMPHNLFFKVGEGNYANLRKLILPQTRLQFYEFLYELSVASVLVEAVRFMQDKRRNADRNFYFVYHDFDRNLWHSRDTYTEFYESIAVMASNFIVGTDKILIVNGENLTPERYDKMMIWEDDYAYKYDSPKTEFVREFISQNLYNIRVNFRDEIGSVHRFVEKFKDMLCSNNGYYLNMPYIPKNNRILYPSYQNPLISLMPFADWGSDKALYKNSRNGELFIDEPMPKQKIKIYQEYRKVRNRKPVEMYEREYYPITLFLNL